MESHPLTTLHQFWSRNRRLPSLEETRKLFHYRSRNSARKLLEKLAKLDYVKKSVRGIFTPGRRFYDLRILGTVTAGWPSPAEEELADTMSLEEWLIGNKEATYMMKVHGDSMINAGIMPGDMVLVERAAEARDGDIVIAEVDHEWTMKYFRKRGGKIYLDPANKKYKPIIPQEELRITAIVKAVIRKY